MQRRDFEGRACTCWASPPPWSRRHAPAAEGLTVTSRLQTTRALLRLLDDDVRRGHVNLALRHFFMLRALDVRPPKEIETRCEGWLGSRPRARSRSIVRQVEAWVEMVIGMKPPLDPR